LQRFAKARLTRVKHLEMENKY